MSERGIQPIELNNALNFTGMKAASLEAHPDDRAMSPGDVALVNAGAEFIGVTCTRGEGRYFPQFTPEELAQVRTIENRNSFRKLGASRLYEGDLPDGKLWTRYSAGVQLLEAVIEEEKPDLLITPHISDQHPDHVAASVIGMHFINKLPIYWSDTISGMDQDSNPLVPTHHILLSRHEMRKGKQLFREQKSQTDNLPEGENRVMFDVLWMAKRRGREIDVRFAGALTLINRRLGDPVRELLGKEKVLVDFTKTSEHHRFSF